VRDVRSPAPSHARGAGGRRRGRGRRRCRRRRRARHRQPRDGRADAGRAPRRGRRAGGARPRGGAAVTTLVPAWPAGLDTPAEPPVIGTDPRRLLEAAESLVTAAGRLREGAAAGACRWAGLPAVYAAAGTEPLYDLLRPVADDGDGLARALESAGDALTEHAQRLERLAVDRADLVDRLRSWRSWAAATEVGAGESWFVAVASHDLRAEVSAFAARVAAAEQACADTLAAIRGGTATGRRRAGRGD